MARAVRRFPAPVPGLIVREFAGDYVVVDPGSRQAHSLSGDAAVVWRCAQGGSLPDLPPARVVEVVGELVGLGLLQRDGVSRRTLLKTGATGGAALALVGVTSIALPPAAAIASTLNTLKFDVDHAPGTVTVPAGVTVSFTLVGGGGGASHTNPGGGDAASISGTITNNSTSAQKLTVVVGGGGGVVSSGEGGTSNGAPAGQGFRGGDAPNGLGPGGGASAILDASDPAVLVVAGGGGGGGQSETGDPAGTSSTQPTGGGGGDSHHNANGVPGAGGNSYWRSVEFDDWTITASGSDATGTGGPAGPYGSPGSDGSAQFSGYGITT